MGIRPTSYVVFNFMVRQIRVYHRVDHTMDQHQNQPLLCGINISDVPYGHSMTQQQAFDIHNENYQSRFSAAGDTRTCLPSRFHVWHGNLWYTTWFSARLSVIHSDSNGPAWISSQNTSVFDHASWAWWFHNVSHIHISRNMCNFIKPWQSQETERRECLRTGISVAIAFHPRLLIFPGTWCLTK